MTASRKEAIAKRDEVRKEKDLVDGSLEYANTALPKLNDAYNNAIKEHREVSNLLKDQKDGLKSLKEDHDRLWAEIIKDNNVTKEEEAQIDVYIKEITLWEEEIKKTEAKVVEAYDKYVAAGEELGDMQAKVEELKVRQKELVKADEELTAKIKSLAKEISEKLLK